MVLWEQTHNGLSLGIDGLRK